MKPKRSKPSKSNAPKTKKRTSKAASKEEKQEELRGSKKATKRNNVTNSPKKREFIEEKSTEEMDLER